MSVSDHSSPISGQFRSTALNRVDAKKRVAIPAGYRAILGGQALVLRKSLRHPCIEAWPATLFEHDLKPISPHADLDDADEDDIYANISLVVDAIPDTEGRIILDRELAQFAAITDQVLFVGKAQIFELWEPAAGRAHLEAAERRRRERLAARRAAA